MKKIFTITVLAAAMIAAATSCQKEQLAGQNDNPLIQGEGLVFYASLENTDTKTTISDEGTAGYKISWEATDSISVNGTIYKAVLDGENPAKATFVKVREGDENPTAPFKVYYPASIYDSTAKAATLPATQVYKADGNIAGVLPMYAESSDLNLNFKNLCGLMKFTLKGTEKVQSITLTDDTKPLSGKFTVSGNAAVLDGAAKGGVSLKCGTDGVQLDETTGKTFYVAVPAGSYENLHIEYSSLNSVKRANMKANATATVERNKVYPFTQTPTFSFNYPCFTALEDGVEVALLKMKTPTVDVVQWSTDRKVWSDVTAQKFSSNDPYPKFVTLAKAGDKVYVRAKNKRTAAQDLRNYIFFTFTKKVEVSGNIMYLVNPEWSGGDDLLGYDFVSLFQYATKPYTYSVDKADRLVLPATTLKEGCYCRMFNYCRGLKTAPSLLPATEMVKDCYNQMFSQCESLLETPALPATKLAPHCYCSMFSGCKSIKTPPSLPVTELADSCYSSIFASCHNLETAPTLPATKLAKYCYSAMFDRCKSLKTPPSLPVTELAEGCYKYMFTGCTSLETAPALPATKLVEHCYDAIFKECPKLSSVTMLATDISPLYCLGDWLRDAGSDKSVTSRIVYVASGMVDAVKATVPSSPDWKTGVQVKP